MFKLPAYVEYIMKILHTAGYEAYVVGGAVRDLMLGRTPEDYDIATSAKPEEIVRLARQHKLKVVDKLGYNFGVVMVLIGESAIEVATYRGENYGIDAHRPAEIWYCQTLKEDLARRDFTINAMALTSQGEIIDYFGGLEDLKRQVLRTVGLAEKRFAEDGLRMFRACRFIAQLGFNYAGKEQFPIARVEGLSRELICIELEKTLLAQYAAKGLDLLLTTGLLNATCKVKINGCEHKISLLPELKHLDGLRQNPQFHCYDVWQHTLAALKLTPQTLTLRWAILLHDVGKGLPCVRKMNAAGQPSDHGHERQSALLTKNILSRLGYKTAFIKRVTWLVAKHMRFAPMLITGEDRLWHWVRTEAQSGEFRSQQEMVEAFEQLVQIFLADMGATNAAANTQLMEAGQELGRKVVAIARQMPVHTSDLDISGVEIGAILLNKGLIGRVISVLLERVQAGNLSNTKEELAKAVRRWRWRQERGMCEE